MSRRSPSAPAGLAVPAVLLGLSGLLILALGGCGSEEKRLERLRARYRVEVAGFVVEQRPLPPTPSATPPAEGSAAPALAQDVRVDIVITDTVASKDRDDRPEPLRLPVELTLAGPGGAVRGRWPAVLEVAAPAGGDEPVRASYHLKAVPFQPGDRFTVAIAEVTGAGEADGPDRAGEDAGRP